MARNALKKNIAILGATGHIGRSLFYHYAKESASEFNLFLFARDVDRVNEFARQNGLQNYSIKTFNDFLNGNSYDVIINAVGYGAPSRHKADIKDVFDISKRFDDLILSYIEKNKDALYVNLSSGAVYGSDFTRPADDSRELGFANQNLKESERYGKAKLELEIRHRERADLNIVDVRIFSYISGFIDLSEKFLLSELISCVKDGREFVTGSGDIVRDFTCPEELIFFIDCSLKRGNINGAFDIFSLKEVRKSELIEFFKDQYALKCRIDEKLRNESVTGAKDNYYSVSRKASSIGFKPKYSSIEMIKKASRDILGR